MNALGLSTFVPVFHGMQVRRYSSDSIDGWETREVAELTHDLEADGWFNLFGGLAAGPVCDECFALPPAFSLVSSAVADPNLCQYCGSLVGGSCDSENVPDDAGDDGHGNEDGYKRNVLFLPPTPHDDFYSSHILPALV